MTRYNGPRFAFCALTGLAAFIGCGDRPPSADNEAHHEVAVGPIAPVQYATSPLTLASPPPPDPQPNGIAVENAEIDARILVITANAASTQYAAVVQALRFLGTPYDTFNAETDGELTADKLAAGNHGRYQAIVLDVGNLSTGTETAFTSGEWGTLAEYETQFKVRRVVLYAYPDATYGLIPGAGIDTTTTPLNVKCTSLGTGIFTDVNCENELEVTNAWAYAADVKDDKTTPVLVGADGKVYAAIHQHLAGRESLVFTFAQSPSLVHSLALMNGAIRWATRGLYLGERHVYLTTQIDDLLLSTALYGSGQNYRISAEELRALFKWQEAHRQEPITADLRFDWAVNGAGSFEAESLVEEAISIGAGFKWINHTWSHPYLDGTPPTGQEKTWAGGYDAALSEFTRNDTFMRTMNFQPYNPVNAVTPHISGLDNPNVMKAAYDAGIRFIVTDTSRTGFDNPTPNAGIFNAHQPGILMIPRRPNNLFFNVSTPDEWVKQYNSLYSAKWGRELTYEEILDRESDVLLQFLLRGENDPWMFHQANARDYGNGRSLLADLHDALLDKYTSVSNLPIVSPTMDEIGKRVGERMKFDASGASAVVGPGHKLTVRVTKDATVPVTGLCTPSSETYGGQKISYITMAAYTEATFSLDNCNPDGPSVVTMPKPPMTGGGGGGCTVAGTTSATTPLLVLGLVGLIVRLRRRHRRIRHDRSCR